MNKKKKENNYKSNNNNSKKPFTNSGIPDLLCFIKYFRYYNQIKEL